MTNTPPQPRVYRVNLIWRCVFPAIIIFTTLYIEYTDRGAWPLVVGLLAIGCIVAVFKLLAFVQITADAIEYHGIFGVKRLPFAAIGGRRVISGGGTGAKQLRIVPNDKALPTISMANDFAFDPAFYAWFNALPDIDAESRARRLSAKGSGHSQKQQ